MVCADAGSGDLHTREFSEWSKVDLNGAPYHGTWETGVRMDRNAREEMGWPAEFEDWKSMQSTALAKRLRAEDIKV